MEDESEKTLLDYLLEPGFDLRLIGDYHRYPKGYSIHASVERTTRWLPEVEGSLETKFEARWIIYRLRAPMYDEPIEKGSMPNDLTAEQVVQWWNETVRMLNKWEPSNGR